MLTSVYGLPQNRLKGEDLISVGLHNVISISNLNPRKSPVTMTTYHLEALHAEICEFPYLFHGRRQK